jgi:RNA polymerase sigma factor (sigma-70 family)
MGETVRTLLHRLFLSDYGELKRRLKRRLGSDDAASEVLHETYLRLDRMGDVGVIESPGAYLFRMSLNVAADRRRSQARRLTAAEVESVREMADHVLDPARIAEARQQVALLERALQELSPRRRAIFIAARLEGISHQALAQRFSISTRMVEKELKRAFDHCAARLGRK